MMLSEVTTQIAYRSRDDQTTQQASIAVFVYFTTSVPVLNTFIESK